MVDRDPPLAWVTLEWSRSVGVDLYRYIPPLGENIPNYVELCLVGDLVSTEDEIEWSVKRLHNHCSRGAFWGAGQTPERVASGGEEKVEEGGGGKTGETYGKE